MESSDVWDGWSRATTFAYGLSELIAVGCSVGAIILVATVIRRNRPDAYTPLLVWSIVALVVGIVWPVAVTLSFRLFAGDSVRTMLRTQTLTTLAGIPLHVLNFVLLMRGLVKLAQPPKPVVADGVGPYR